MITTIQLKQVVIGVVAAYFAWKLLGLTIEAFHSGMNLYLNRDVWWNPERNTHYIVDPQLTNLYRKWHNIEGVNRVDVLGHAHVKTGGGGHGIDRQFLMAETLDREAQLIQKQIRDKISLQRSIKNQRIGNQLKSPLGGNFNDCHLGNCQWNEDVDSNILGIPSVIGVRHTYY